MDDIFWPKSINNSQLEFRHERLFGRKIFVKWPYPLFSNFLFWTGHNETKLTKTLLIKIFEDHYWLYS